MKYGDSLYRAAVYRLSVVSRAFALVIPHELAPASEAPSSLEELQGMWATRHRIVVSRDHCETSIHATPRSNAEFRVWRAWRHLTTGAPFYCEGGSAVFLAQARDLRAFSGPFSCARREEDAAVHLLRCEILGQLDHLERTGEFFPPDQREFTAQWLIDNPL